MSRKSKPHNMGHMQHQVHFKQHKCKHIYVYVVVGGMVGMHANDLLMNSSTVSRQTEPNSEKIGFAFESDICFDRDIC